MRKLQIIRILHVRKFSWFGQNDQQDLENDNLFTSVISVKLYASNYTILKICYQKLIEYLEHWY